MGLHMLSIQEYFSSLLLAQQLVLQFGFLIGFAGLISVVVVIFYTIQLINVQFGGQVLYFYVEFLHVVFLVLLLLIDLDLLYKVLIAHLKDFIMIAYMDNSKKLIQNGKVSTTLKNIYLYQILSLETLKKTVMI